MAAPRNATSIAGGSSARSSSSASAKSAKPRLDAGHAGCRDLLVLAAEQLGWELDLHNGGTAIWVDNERSAVDRLAKLRQGEWMSWIPSVPDTCGKVALAEILEARQNQFWPRSWRVPGSDAQSISAAVFGEGKRKGATVIVKPDQGSQGSGIALAQSQRELSRVINHLPPEGAIVQEYVARPLLLDRYKWDVRLYALMMPSRGGGHSCFLLEEGLVRVCVEPYVAPAAGNINQTMVHLTNYSLSKFSDKYAHSGDPNDATEGCKRTLSAVLRKLEAEGSISAAAVWGALGELTRTTVDAISERIGPQSGGGLNRCFHLLGLDVLLDEAGMPWLLEVNHRPSLLIDEVHPLADMSRAEENRLKAERRSGSKWGRPCRCSLHHRLHEHQPCHVDVAVKLPAVAGALSIVRQAKAGREVAAWANGSAYRLV